MPPMIDADVMTPEEIREAEADEWHSAICPDCGARGADHDDGLCPDPVLLAVSRAVAAVPFPACSLYDPADTDDIAHAYDTWRKLRIAAARRALDTLAGKK